VSPEGAISYIAADFLHVLLYYRNWKCCH